MIQSFRYFSIAILLSFISTTLFNCSEAKMSPTVAEAPEAKTDSAGDIDHDSGIEPAQKINTSEKYRLKTPELLARINSPNMQALPLMSQDISVVIVGHRARVVLDLIYKNPSDRTLSGTLMISLPNGASPSYLGMFQGEGTKSQNVKNWLSPDVPDTDQLLAKDIKLPSRLSNDNQDRDSAQLDFGELRSAKVVSPVQGRMVYESTVRRRIDPALSEWAGGSKFSTRVFPIQPNGYKRLIFAYDRPLKASDHLVDYPLPLPDKLDAESRITIHSFKDHYTKQRVYSGTKELQYRETKDGYHWQIKLNDNHNKNLSFRGQPINSRVQSLVGSSIGVTGKLLHFNYHPKVIPSTKKTKTGRAVFILDTSYSSKDKLFSKSGEMLRGILENDKSITEFALVHFDVVARRMTAGFIPNSPEKRKKVFSVLDKIWLEGATDFSSVLELISKNKQLSTADSYFLLSDGEITWGVDNPMKLSRQYKSLFSKRWYCYSFGESSVNQSLFNELSKSRGQIIHVGLGQDIKTASLAHISEASVFDGISSSSDIDFVIAGDPKKVFPGQVLEVAARVPDKLSSLSVTFEINGQKDTVTILLLVQKAYNHVACRAWANLYSQRLLDMYDDEVNETVLALSQHFSLSNREASFIILETDKEYFEHSIDNNNLNIKQLEATLLKRSSGKEFGAPDSATLSKESQNFIRSLSQVPKTAVWDVKQSRMISKSLASLTAKKIQRDNDYPQTLYLSAKKLIDSNKAYEALRVLSTIIELKPQDDVSARLVGYVLLEWGYYHQAEQLFAKVRRRRPFEPQNLLLEAMALAAQGKIKDAAIRYELLLAGDPNWSRFNQYAQPTVARLYKDLLQAIPKSDDSEARLSDLNKILSDEIRGGRLYLFWNLDNSDVDVYINEGDETVSYRSKTSSTGGILYWDNTTGLGPELYEHPSLSKDGFRVSVNYFGNRDVEGVAPAATLICAMNFRQNQLPLMRWYSTILIGANSGEDQIQIMPLWKR